MRKKAIQELLKSNIKSEKELMIIKRKLAKKYKLTMLVNSEILTEFKKDKKLLNSKKGLVFSSLLRRRSIRTLSGVAPVAVLTMPYPCPGKCAYCPTEKNVPTSYLSNEPAVMRAIRCDYNPYTQVQDRLRALETNGHNPNKIELIVIGGTWSVLPQNYKYWYIKECFRAANDYIKESKKSSFNKKLRINKLKIELTKEQRKNEKTKYKLIGVTLETRPDYINKNELIEMRDLGCTRVELGVQAIDDKILKLNKRGHGVREVVEATKLLKDFGFKVTYHIMPGLPGSTAAKDLEMFKLLFRDEKFQPDQIKFYPTVVTKGSLLYSWWKKGKYKPYNDKTLQNLIINCKKIVPKYVRIIRLIRDIPGESIIAGNMITNLRQIMQAQGVKCNCIRCRESRECELNNKNVKLQIIKYKASGGLEFFISYESKDKKTLYGFCRLRLKDNIALIRELHVYGELVPVGQIKKTQHAGLGKKLIQEAEKISQKNKCKEIKIISGIGARGYYRKFNYRLKNTYMIKFLKN